MDRFMITYILIALIPVALWAGYLVGFARSNMIFKEMLERQDGLIVKRDLLNEFVGRTECHRPGDSLFG